jgi:threonine/homoserine/homoserine lactone efflux protein
LLPGLRSVAFAWLTQLSDPKTAVFYASIFAAMLPASPVVWLLVLPPPLVFAVEMTISLAFLAPKLVRAAVQGRLPRGINIERLRDAPAEWSQQFEALGLNPLS